MMIISSMHIEIAFRDISVVVIIISVGGLVSLFLMDNNVCSYKLT